MYLSRFRSCVVLLFSRIIASFKRPRQACGAVFATSPILAHFQREPIRNRIATVPQTTTVLRPVVESCSPMQYADKTLIWQMDRQALMLVARLELPSWQLAFESYPTKLSSSCEGPSCNKTRHSMINYVSIEHLDALYVSFIEHLDVRYYIPQNNDKSGSHIDIYKLFY